MLIDAELAGVEQGSKVAEGQEAQPRAVCEANEHGENPPFDACGTEAISLPFLLSLVGYVALLPDATPSPDLSNRHLGLTASLNFFRLLVRE